MDGSYGIGRDTHGPAAEGKAFLPRLALGIQMRDERLTERIEIHADSLSVYLPDPPTGRLSGSLEVAGLGEAPLWPLFGHLTPRRRALLHLQEENYVAGEDEIDGEMKLEKTSKRRKHSQK